MDLEITGLVVGSAVCLALLKLRNKEEPEVIAVNGKSAVVASPELEHFLAGLGQEKLLTPLTTWGARTPSDLKWLGEDDFHELGIAQDNAIRDAIHNLN